MPGNLVNSDNDAVYIIKWKDIYTLFEDASDRAEDIAMFSKDRPETCLRS